VSKVLDLRQPDSLKLFHSERGDLLRERGRVDSHSHVDGRKLDSEALTELKKKLHFDAVIASFHIQLDRPRLALWQSRLPNVTVLCLTNPFKSISSIELFRIDDIRVCPSVYRNRERHGIPI